MCQTYNVIKGLIHDTYPFITQAEDVFQWCGSTNFLLSFPAKC